MVGEMPNLVFENQQLFGSISFCRAAALLSGAEHENPDAPPPTPKKLGVIMQGPFRGLNKPLLGHFEPLLSEF